jgi:hypothetical protein
MKLITFICEDEEYPLGAPIPAKNEIPEWYKNGEVYYQNKEKHECNSPRCKHNGDKSPGLKTCMPMFDILTSGYFLVTPFDIYVGKNEDGSLKITWNGPESWSGFVGEREKESGATIPRPAGHLPNHLVWSSKWGWKTPKGYSLIITHPFNRYDLPFTTMSGFEDTDKVFVNGNIPFFIKEGFSGLIPAGTPIIQMIPVKRDRWKGIIDNAKLDLMKRQISKISREKKYYKKVLWVRKEYN